MQLQTRNSKNEWPPLKASRKIWNRSSPRAFVRAWPSLTLIQTSDPQKHEHFHYFEAPSLTYLVTGALRPNTRSVIKEAFNNMFTNAREPEHTEEKVDVHSRPVNA
jgi:hypothetical protein